MAEYKTIIDALSANDLDIARDMLLAETLEKTKGKNSWDSPQYRGNKELQSKIKLQPENNKLITYFGLENIRDRYFLKDENKNIVENPQTFFARVAAGLSKDDETLAQKLYDAMSKCWFLPSTPILTNIASNRGLTISCFLNTMEDSINGIFETITENAFLSKYGGGIGTDMSDLRGHNSKLSTGGVSSGVIPFIKIIDSELLAVSQGGVRRGGGAIYLRVDHPDIEEFIEVRKPTGGDHNRKSLNINHGIVVTDEFMKAVESKGKYWLIDPHWKTQVKELDAVDVWRKILKTRVETGEPYILFIDNVNKATPKHHAEKGLWVRQSNLCCEITLPTTYDRTAVCCLAHVNFEKYDEWKDQAEKLIYNYVKALDNNLDVFIENADGKEFEKSIRSVTHERSIGLGAMGYHGYLMSKNIPFESITARAINKELFGTLHKYAIQASKQLGVERGLPLDGGDQRNSYVIAIAPNASTSFICNEATPGIEPIAANAYLQKTLSGSFLVKNKHLVRVLEEKGKNNQDVWKQVIADKGSVMNLPDDVLTIEEKRVFRTPYEMNMREIVQQAADRQKFVCQAQSLNVFFPTPISGKYLDEVHQLAWKAGVKSLYYLRSSAPIEAERIERNAAVTVTVEKRDLANEECAVCQ